MPFAAELDNPGFSMAGNTEQFEEIYFSIVVLCYRGGNSIIPLVEKMHAMLSRYGFAWEIILVGNYIEGEVDDTPAVVRELASRLSHVKAVALPKKGMAGWDLRSGLETARGKYIGFIDGDGQMPVDSISACLAKIEMDGSDFVMTYRVSRGDGLYRNLISALYNRLFRMLFKKGPRDVNSNPKIFLRSKYELMDLQSDDWFIDAEIVLKAGELGLKIDEVPMHFYALEGRPSFVDFKTIREFLGNMFQYKVRGIPWRTKANLEERKG